MGHDCRCARTRTACKRSASTAFPRADFNVMVVYDLDIVHICIRWECIVFFKNRSLCCNWCFSDVVHKNFCVRYTEKNGTYRYCFAIYIEVYIDDLIHGYIHRNVFTVKERFAHIYCHLSNNAIFNG